MKLTRERKYIGGVLVLALAAFGYDCISAGGDGAAAVDSGNLLLATTPSHKSSVAPVVPAGPTLARRLSDLASQTGTPAPDDLRDVFELPASWRPNASQPTPQVAAHESSGDKFAQSHKLTAISHNAQGGAVAIVDGKLLHLGASVDGFQLIGLDRTHASFRDGTGVTVQLKLNAEMALGQ